MSKYIIGTRGSLLAVTQSTLIKNQLEKITGDQFELKTIKTQGDLQTDKPLWQLDGKDFFTKELDSALLAGEVDLVLHSYKDLGSERPPGIQLATITKRHYGEDILLIKNETIKKLKDIKEFVVGTSSPRRIVNLENQLSNFLPHGDSLSVQTEMLRGNVNTRVEKLKEDKYHAIVLAMAGLERLAQGEDSRQTLKELLTDLNYMILPQSTFPSAASQGALGIEIAESRDDNNELLNKLKKIEDALTVNEMKKERAAFNNYGGGCHLAVGIQVEKIENFYVEYHRGKTEGKEIDIKTMSPMPKLAPTKYYFLGMPKNSDKEYDESTYLYDEYITKWPTNQSNEKKTAHHFITTKYALAQFEKSYQAGTIWAAGKRSMKALLKRGFFVNGHADTLGHDRIAHYLNSKLLKMFENSQNEVLVYTNDQAKTDIGQVIPSYTKKFNELSENYVEKLKETKVFYWTSFSQYSSFTQKFPFIKDPSCQHCCGLGKTRKEFRANNIEITPLFSPKLFIELIHPKR